MGIFGVCDRVPQVLAPETDGVRIEHLGVDAEPVDQAGAAPWGPRRRVHVPDAPRATLRVLERVLVPSWSTVPPDPALPNVLPSMTHMSIPSMCSTWGTLSS